MSRRGTSSSGKIHYRVNINRNMCLGVVDIYIDGKPYRPGFNGSYLDIYRDKRIRAISVSGRISYLNPENGYNVILGVSGGIIEGTLTYRYNSGMRCELADKVIYGNRITDLVPVTVIADPGKIIDFTCRPELRTQVLDEGYVTWDGDYVLNDNCIVTDPCPGRESYAYGESSHGSYRVTARIAWRQGKGVDLIPPGLPRPPSASRYFWPPSGFILKFSYLRDKTIIMFRDIFHGLKIFFCDDDVERIYIRDSTVIRDNEIHKTHDEILDEPGDLAAVVSRNYVYGKIKDRAGLGIRHIGRIINHAKVGGI